MPTFSFRSSPKPAMESNSSQSKKIVSQHPPQLGPEHARPLRKPSPQHLQAQTGASQSSKPLPSAPSDPTTTTTTARTLRPSPSASSFRHPSPAVSAPISPAPSSSEYSQRSASPSNSNSSSHADTDTANTTTTTITTVASDDDSSPAVPPLTRVHFFCYHYHRTFAPSRNTHNPVPCMTCLKADAGKDSRRWRCTFCCLRICTDCVRGIGKCKDRSLMVFMEELVTALEQEGKQMQADRESRTSGSDEDNNDGGSGSGETCSK